MKWMKFEPHEEIMVTILIAALIITIWVPVLTYLLHGDGNTIVLIFGQTNNTVEPLKPLLWRVILAW